MGQMKEVVCFETGEHFKSQKDAAEKLGVSFHSISASVTREIAVKGFHFYRADDQRLTDATFRPKPLRNKRVRCVETGIVYESAKQAGRMTGINPVRISAAASHKANGYHWEYVDD